MSVGKTSVEINLPDFVDFVLNSGHAQPDKTDRITAIRSYATAFMQLYNER